MIIKPLALTNASFNTLILKHPEKGCQVDVKDKDLTLKAGD